MTSYIRYETKPLFESHSEAKTVLNRHFKDNIDNLCELLSKGYVCLAEWDDYSEQMKTLSKVFNEAIHVRRIKMRTLEAIFEKYSSKVKSL